MECCGLVGRTAVPGSVNFSPSALDAAVCDCGHKRFRHRVVEKASAELSALTEQVARLSTLVTSVSHKQDEEIRAMKPINVALAFVQGQGPQLFLTR